MTNWAFKKCHTTSVIIILLGQINTRNFGRQEMRRIIEVVYKVRLHTFKGDMRGIMRTKKRPWSTLDTHVYKISSLHKVIIS